MILFHDTDNEYRSRMAYPENHFLLAFGGRLRTSETWTQTLRFRKPFNLSGQAEVQAVCDEMADRLSDWWSTGISGSGAVLELVKFNEIGTNGRYVSPFTCLTELVPGVANSGESLFPNQVSVVVTTLTDASRGLAARGRMFFPIPTVSVQADGMINSTAVGNIGTAAKTLLDSLNGAEAGVVASVFSAVGAGAVRPITAVGVGRVLDTIRTRRQALTEERSTVALAAVP